MQILWMVIPIMLDSNLRIVCEPSGLFFYLIPVSSILYILKFFIIKYLHREVNQH